MTETEGGQGLHGDTHLQIDTDRPTVGDALDLDHALPDIPIDTMTVMVR